MTMQINFSQAALTHIADLIQQNNSLGFRLSIKKTGCSGYSYFPSLITEINLQDELHEIDGLKIYIDTTWKNLLQNLQVDYVIEDAMGLKQKKLVFNNPNESSRCGCGESFHVS